MKKLLLFVLFITCFKVDAQRVSAYDNGDRDLESGWGFALQSHYDVPTSNFGYTFKPTVAYGASLINFQDHFVMNFTLGYEVFKPKLDTFYYQVDDKSFGTIKYENYTSLSAYLGFSYNIKPTDQLWIFGGLNFGAYYTRYAYQSADKYRGDEVDFHEQNLYVAPKAGITYALSTYVLLSFESKYNYFAPTGKASNNDRIGTVYSSFANGLAVTYKF